MVFMAVPEFMIHVSFELKSLNLFIIDSLVIFLQLVLV